MIETPTGESKEASEFIKDCIKSGPQINLIIGNSGSGKTFTFLKSFEGLRDDFIDGGTKIPIFVELYRRANCTIKELIMKDMNENLFKADYVNYVLFLDGMNEGGDIIRCLDEIGRFAARHREAKLFISTQREEGLDKTGIPVYRIKSFSDEQIISYLQTSLGYSRGEAEGFYQGLYPVLKKEISLPIFLHMLTAPLEWGIGQEDTGQSSRTPPRNLGELFNNFEEFVCGERSSPHARSPLDDRFRNRMIPYLAFNMCLKGGLQLTKSEVYEHLKNFKNKESEGFDSDDFIKKVTKEYWIAYLRGDSFRFTHDLLRDYFTARYIKDKGMGINKVVGLVFKDGNPNPPFDSVAQLLCGIESEERIRQLIQGILNKNPDKAPHLAASCFAVSNSNDIDLFKAVSNAIQPDAPDYLYLDRLPHFHLRGLELLKGEKGQPEYATCQNNLGTAYCRLSEVRDREANLGLAIKCYNEALKIRTKEALPWYFVEASGNLAVALRMKGDITGALWVLEEMLPVAEKIRHPILYERLK
ncbi:MAG: NACHT domain-containing protein [Candidatus Brocadiales bacterium]